MKQSWHGKHQPEYYITPLKNKDRCICVFVFEKMIESSPLKRRARWIQKQRSRRFPCFPSMLKNILSHYKKNFHQVESKSRRRKTTWKQLCLADVARAREKLAPLKTRTNVPSRLSPPGCVMVIMVIMVIMMMMMVTVMMVIQKEEAFSSQLQSSFLCDDDCLFEH